MNRKTLEKTLRSHYPIFQSLWIICACGNLRYLSHGEDSLFEWSEHVADVIYPRS